MAGRTVSLVEYRSLIGAEVGLSSWIEIDQARINAFAQATLDWQSIHVDPETAKTSVFGGTIAHGFLTLSLLSAMAQEALPAIESATTGVNFGINNLRFVAPVRSGKRVRGRFVLMAVSDRSPGVVQATLGVQVEIENEAKPAIVAEWVVLFHV
jgi:acyl dehydratase